MMISGEELHVTVVAQTFATGEEFRDVTQLQ
jgi:hypothetical protein